MAGGSQSSGTPVKSCSRMRASTNGISSVRGATAFQPASCRTCSSVTFLPSQLRRTDSRTIRMETGNRSIGRLSFLDSAGSEKSLPCLNVCSVSSNLCGIEASIVGPEGGRAARPLFLEQVQSGDEFGALFQQRRKVEITTRDRSGVVADLFAKLGDSGLQLGFRHMTKRSTNSSTGVLSSRAASMHTSRMALCCFEGKRRARLVLNFSTRMGMPSLRRRLWPIGYSHTTSSSLEPSLNSTVSAFAIERLAGSR